MNESVGLVTRLKTVLQELHENPHPHIPTPPPCKKRASVALVLRIRPTFPYKDERTSSLDIVYSQSFKSRSEFFFDQEWVQKGDLEVLFIKRAARSGDRWTGHIALPGGKREPSDPDDRTTAIRETEEEVGLDLNAEHCVFVGNLPERVITTNWGNTPLMVLCPFVFLLLKHDIPPLALQPAEVHSTHWVPIRGLLSPSLRSTERADISDRLKPLQGPFMTTLIRAATGRLIFSSTLLTPSETLHCSSAPGFIPTLNPIQTPLNDIILSHLTAFLGLTSQPPRPGTSGPYPLWGLTLGILADILHPLDPAATLTLWSWPTFSHYDIRLILWLLTNDLRNTSEKTRNGRSSSSGRSSSNGAGSEVKGMDSTTSALSPWQQQSSLAAAHMPDEYFRLMRRAVVWAFVVRVSVLMGVVAVVIARYYSAWV